MRKIATLILLAVVGLFATNVSANDYKLDHAAVDAMFAQAEVIELDTFSAESLMTNNNSGGAILQEKDPVIAFLLSWFVGYLGIHRAYLGTSTGTIIAYILTLGGCGIVVTIDWVMLLVGLVNDDISKYVDNPSFFMW